MRKTTNDCLADLQENDAGSYRFSGKESTNCLRIMAQNQCKTAQSSMDLIDSTGQIDSCLSTENLNVFGIEDGDSGWVRTSDLMLRRYLTLQKCSQKQVFFEAVYKESTNCLRIFVKSDCFRVFFIPVGIKFLITTCINNTTTRSPWIWRASQWKMISNHVRNIRDL
jgi:hypothetical protein